MSNALTKTERKEHAQDVAIVTKNIGAFVETGQALARIRDGRTYRESHETFEAFCRETWEFGRIQAHRLIAAAEVRERLLPMGNIVPVNERQARPLTTIDLEQVGDCWQEVIEKAPKDDDGKPIITGKHVQETVGFWKAADETYVEDVFDCEQELSLLFEKVRHILTRWPDEHRPTASKALTQLAKESAL